MTNNVFYDAEKVQYLYKIQKGDTLESIALKLNVDLDDLRQFHNGHSIVDDCLAGTLRSHLKFLVISPEKEEAIIEEKKTQKTPFSGKDYWLPFRPWIVSETKYSVLYTIEKGDEIQTLEQNFSVKRLKPETDQIDYHFFEINKISELLINGKPANSKACILAEETAAILYPLRIITDNLGKWKDINSYHKINERWESKKKEINKSNDIKSIEDCINNIEKKIEDKFSLTNILSSNWFLKALFNGIHVPYTEELEFEKTIYFPAIAEMDDLEFLITQKVNPNLDDMNQIEVTQKGELDDEYVEGYYSANYFLNPNNYQIEHLVLECNIVDINEKRTVRISNLDNKKIQLDSGVSLLV